MDKKGFGGITGIIILLIFGVIWVTGLAPMLTATGNVAIENGATGLEGFFYGNLNLLVGFFYALAWFVTLKYGD